MECNFQSRIPLSVCKRQKSAKNILQNPLTKINLNQRFCNSLANAKQSEIVPRNPCAFCVTATKPPAILYPKHPPLDDYKGRYKNLLEKFETLNQKLALTKSELDGANEKNEILENKLAAAEAEVKSVRQDSKRSKAMNKTYELTIGVLERKIAELSGPADVDGDEVNLTRYGRSVRAPVKYQANSS